MDLAGCDGGGVWEGGERTGGRGGEKRMQAGAVAREEGELVCTAVGACGASAEKL
eukprot:COSAG01_NODE_69974_length_260_cov_0.428571_1_plen_54_part_01